MKNSTRIKIAASATALFLVGVTAGGLAVRGTSEAQPNQVSTTAGRTETINQTKVRTVHVRRKPNAATPNVSSGQGAQAVTSGSPTIAAVSQPSPEPVTTRVSPTGSAESDDDHGEHREAEDHDDEYEHEGYESDDDHGDD